MPSLPTAAETRDVDEMGHCVVVSASKRTPASSHYTSITLIYVSSVDCESTNLLRDATSITFGGQILDANFTGVLSFAANSCKEFAAVPTCSFDSPH